MKRRRRCHRGKGFDADGGAFTLSCSALLCCACRGVVWCAGTLGRVGADNGDLELEMGAWCWLSDVGPFPRPGF